MFTNLLFMPTIKKKNISEKFNHCKFFFFHFILMQNMKKKSFETKVSKI